MLIPQELQLSPRIYLASLSQVVMDEANHKVLSSI